MQAETSQQAFDTVRPMLRSMQEEVLAVIKRHPCGITDEQLIQQSGLRPNTCRPRRIELVALGYVVDSGDRTKTISGRQAVLWKAV